MRILFQGDSITDAGRDYSDPLHLGDGYAFMAARMIRARFPEEDFTFYNRGVSGNRSRDLAARWQADCIDLKPDLVSILVGVNDVWRAFDEKDPTSAEQYEETVRTMLEDVRTKTGARILLMEPFVVIARPEQEEWQPDLQPKIAALRRLAREYADAYIPLDGLFAAACIDRPPAYWTLDGVHPSDEGEWLIAGQYADAVAKILHRRDRDGRTR